MKNKKICVIGLGYIGLPTAILFANNGFYIHGVDKNPDIIDSISKGCTNIDEPDINEMLENVLKFKTLEVSDTQSKADVFIICVPTPIQYDLGNKPDMKYVESAITEMSPLLESGNLVILESTSPLGTTNLIETKLIENGVDTSSIDIAYCPERVLPGNIIFEMVNNDRVIGGINNRSTIAASDLYRKICQGSIFETNAKTAELCKLTENSFRDVNIAFANEISLICEFENIDVTNLINLANRHPRVNILNPGIGVGGHCIPVDPWFIISNYKSSTPLIHTARNVNTSKTEWVVEKIIKKVNDTKISHPKIACLGLTYKANSSDIRESPSIKIMNRLLLEKFDVVAVDPNIKTCCEYRLVDLGEALIDTDFIIILVNHDMFQDNLHSISKSKAIIMDFCGLL